MNPSVPSPEEQKVIELVWEHFTRELKWPSRRAVMRLCEKEGFEFHFEPERYPSIHMKDFSKEVSLPLEIILERPGVRDLLRPVPDLLRLGAQRFLDNPEFNDKLSRISINQEDFARSWPDPHQRALVRSIFDICAFNLGIGSSAGQTEFAYHCDIYSLRYESVQTLDEALTIRERVPVLQDVRAPSGPHLQLIQAIYDYTLSHGQWPTALTFAVEHRGIGFIPDLILPLRNIYFRSDFGSSSHHHLSLTIWALQAVDTTGATRDKFVKIIDKLVHFWKRSPDEGEYVSVKITDLSQAAGLSLPETIQIVLFIESEPLWRGGNFGIDRSGWAIRIDDTILKYQRIKNWDDYIEVRTRQHHTPNPLAFFDSATTAPDEITSVLADEPTFVRTQESTEPGEEANDSTFDVAIICALSKPELEKVKKIRGTSWEQIQAEKRDTHIYYRATYTTRKGNPIRVVASAPHSMGPAAAAVLTTKLVLRFQPKLVIMVGIAAGSKPGHQGFGDILVANHTFDYDSGKLTETEGRIEFQPSPSPHTVDSRLLHVLASWDRSAAELDEIAREWPAAQPNTRLRAHVGPMGSGAAVVATRQPILDASSHWRKLVGIEMEAHAVHVACHETLASGPKFLCFKSISDFGENKNDMWRDFAAYTAAEYSYRFLIHEWENLNLG